MSQEKKSTTKATKRIETEPSKITAAINLFETKLTIHIIQSLLISNALNQNIKQE